MRDKSLLVEVLCDAEDVLIWSVAVTPAIERLKIWEFDSTRGWRSLPDVPERANEPAGAPDAINQFTGRKSIHL